VKTKTIGYKHAMITVFWLS